MIISNLQGHADDRYSDYQDRREKYLKNIVKIYGNLYSNLESQKNRLDQPKKHVHFNDRVIYDEAQADKVMDGIKKPRIVDKSLRLNVLVSSGLKENVDETLKERENPNRDQKRAFDSIIYKIKENMQALI